MGKKRTRNTAKTGDRSLYKSRLGNQGIIAKGGGGGKKKDDDDDDMYDEVERFHRDRDKEQFLKFDDGEDDEEEDEDEEEAVMNLDVGGGDSSSSEEEEEESGEDDGQEDDIDDGSEEEDVSSSSDDDDDDDYEMKKEDVRNWGKKKSSYYQGDTADLEIGQDEEDAFLEEEAAKEVQEARMEDMAEEDFLVSDDDDEEQQQRDGNKIEAVAPTAKTATDTAAAFSRLSTKETRKLLNKQHPEFLPLLSYFSGVVRELDTSTAVAARALFDGEEEGAAEAVGATKLGQQYLLTKALLQSSTALNLAVYLLLKAEHAKQEGGDKYALIQNHPVLSRLQKWNAMSQKLEDDVENKVDGLRDQLDNLVQAAALMKSDARGGEDKASSTATSESKTSEEDTSDDSSVDMNSDDSDNEEEAGKPKMPNGPSPGNRDGTELASSTQSVMHEARFGLRPAEVAAASDTKLRRKRRRAPDYSDVGDVGGADDDIPAKSLASTLNSIQQRSATRKRKPARLDDDIDETEDNEDYGGDGEEADFDNGPSFGVDNDERSGDEILDDAELEEEEDGFYARAGKKAKSHKEKKEGLYRVAPKYPRVETSVDGERGVGRAIMKNRGLVAHKSKMNRNPRVKKREQYRRAVIRRKGAVREVRVDEGHKYGGEGTGIKSGLSRSRKLR